MESQNSVGKRIIWAVSMVVLCTFLTFFMSMFLGSAFPEMNFIYKAGIPVLVFAVLGIAGFGIKNFFMPYIEDLSVPEWLRNIIPVLLIGLGILLGQFTYDEYADVVFGTEAFQEFVISGKIYDATELSFQGIYQSGLEIVSILLGRCVFAVSFYNRLYLVLIAIFIYFAIKNITGTSSLVANLFLILFFCSKQTMEYSVTPDASLVYVLLVAVFIFSVSLVYHYRSRSTNLIAQVIAVFLMGCLFAILFIAETNSLILVLPAIVVLFSGKSIQDKRWYYILAVEGILLILITCVVIFVLRPELLLDIRFELPTINAVELKITTLLVLNVIGFIGVFGMWEQKLYYIIPAWMSIYYMFIDTDFVSGISGEFCAFICFELYAIFGIGLLGAWNGGVVPVKITKEDEKKEDNVEEKGEQISDEQKEIESIKALNAKLNETPADFVPLTFKKPKRQEKKSIDYAYEPTPEEMKYDVDVPDDDDFDIF